MIPTAEDYIMENTDIMTMAGNKPKVAKALVEFAKLHVEAALQEAYLKSKIIDDPYSYTGNTGSEYPADQIISRESIINSYPLTNIK